MTVSFPIVILYFFFFFFFFLMIRRPPRSTLFPYRRSSDLVETRLELEGHLVERPAEQRELVAALNGDALFEVTARDCVGRVHQTPDRPHDCPTFDVGHAGHEHERCDEADEQLVRGLSVGSVDERLWADHAERRAGPFFERARNQSPVL